MADFDQAESAPAPAQQAAPPPAAEAPAAPAHAPAPAPAESVSQAGNPLLAAIATPYKHTFSSEKTDDDGEGDSTTKKSEATVGVDASAKTASVEASHSSSAQTDTTKSDTTVKGGATAGMDGGKGDASVSHSESIDHGDGSKESSSTTVKGDLDVKNGDVSGGGAVSGERSSSTEDKDSGAKASKSDKVDADVHVGDGDTKVGAGYDRARSSDSGDGVTSDSKTHVDGHVGEQGSGGKASYESTSGSDDGLGDKSAVKTSASGKVDVDAKGNVSGDVDASRSSTTDTDHGDGSKESSTNTWKGDLSVKDGNVSGGGAVSSERSSSTDDKDSGEKAGKNDKVDVDVHVGDGDTKVGGDYDRTRTSDNGAAKTSDSTKLDGHVGEKDSGGSVAQTSSVSTEGPDGRTTKSDTTTKAGVSVDDKGTTLDASRKNASTETDGNGASQTSSSDVSGKVNIDGKGNASVDASGKVANDRSYKDDDSSLATNRGGSADGSVHVGPDKASLQGGVEAHNSETDEDGHTVAQSGKITAGASTNDKGESTYNAGATAKSSDSYSDKDAGVAGNTEKSGTVNVSSGPDKTTVSGEMAAKKSMGMDGTGSAENTARANASVSVDKDGKTSATMGGGTEAKQSVTNDDGTTNSTSTRKDASVTFGSDGSFQGKAGASKTNETESKDADGNTTKNASTMSGSVTAGQDADGTQHLGANGSMSNTTTNADGSKSTSGVDAGGEIITGDGKDGASGHAGVTQDGTRVGVSGGYQNTFGQATQNKDGTWSVPYSSTKQGGVDASGGSDSAKAGASVGGSESTFGSRSFASKEEADAFRAKGEVPSTEVPKTAADAANLPAGTTIGTSSSGNAGVNGSASGGGIGVTAGGSVQSGSSIAVTSKGNGVVEVSSSSTSGVSGTAGMTGGVVGASGTAGSKDSSSKTLQFDLNTDEGKAAYEQYLKDPSKVPESGAKDMGGTESHESSKGWNASALGGQMGESSTTKDSVQKDADGNVVATDHQGTNEHGESIPLWGHEKVSSNLDIYNKDGQTYYTGHTSVDATKASDANAALAEATHTAADQNVSGNAQGKYQVDTQYDAKTMEQFANKVENGEYKPTSTMQQDQTEQLRKDLQAAGDDPEARQKAIAKFASEGGDKAMGEVKQATGVDGEHYVKLEGDKYLTGAEGRQQLDQQMSQYEKAVNAGAGGTDPSTVGDVRQMLADQQERARAIANPANYPDLPSDARAQETARAQADVDRLQKMLGQAKDDRDAFGDPPANAPDQETKDKAQQSMDAMNAATADQDKAYADARLQHKIQDGYYSGYAASTAREQLGDKTLGVFDNSETKAYGTADKSYADAQAAQRDADHWQSVAEHAGDDDAESAAKSADAAQRAAAARQLAAQRYAAANQGYQDIQSRHKDDVEGGTWDGDHHQLKPGE